VKKRKWEIGNRKWQRWLRIYAFCFFALWSLFPITYSLFPQTSVFAADTVLRAGVSIDKVPKDLFGTWRVSSKLTSTNAEEIFKPKSVDLWNLSRAGNVITLDNPFSGANASIVINTVDGRTIKFKRIGDYNNKKLTDTVQLVLGKDSFKGINNLRLETISEVDGHIMKTEWATYSLLGEKISGETIK